MYNLIPCVLCSLSRSYVDPYTYRQYTVRSSEKKWEHMGCLLTVRQGAVSIVLHTFPKRWPLGVCSLHPGCFHNVISRPGRSICLNSLRNFTSWLYYVFTACGSSMLL